jgi:predicted TIM-barrel fold metal-dependent hydrolase
VSREFDYRFVSADGHVAEPPEIWAERIEPRFRDRAPRIERRDDGDYLIIEGQPPMRTMDDNVMADNSRGGDWMAKGRAGGWDPHARLADQDLDNVRSEVIYFGALLTFFSTPDVEYRRAIIKAYNDWLIDYCAVAPDRLIGAGALPVGGPIEWAIEEARRVIDKGLRTVVLPAETPECRYSRPQWDPLWSALQDLGIPVSIHAGTTTGEPFSKAIEDMGFGGAMVDFKIGMALRTMSQVLWAGVPQKFPRLRIVIAEGGIGWVACLLRLMDHWWKDHGHRMEPRLTEPPSYYFNRQVWATFEDDRPGLLTRELLNIEHLMWGGDYPHLEGTFPFSRDQITKDFAGIPENEVRMMTAENAARLYRV